MISEEMDFILFDTGAGLSKETLKFITAADECLVVTTPEPTSITDAYALIKVVHGMEADVPFRLVINRVSGSMKPNRSPIRFHWSRGVSSTWISPRLAISAMIPM